MRLSMQALEGYRMTEVPSLTGHSHKLHDAHAELLDWHDFQKLSELAPVEPETLQQIVCKHCGWQRCITFCRRHQIWGSKSQPDEGLFAPALVMPNCLLLLN